MSGDDRSPAPFGRRLARVAGRRELGPYSVLEVDDPGGPKPRAGQFHMLAAAERWGGGEGERPYLPRAFSVALAPAAGRLEFLLEEVGPGTARLAELGPGDGLWLLGPLGNGFPPARDGAGEVLLVGGGVGIAPLAIRQAELAAAGRDATPLLGFRDAAHAAGAGLLERPAIATDDGGAGLLERPAIATDDGGAGHHGPVTDLLAARLVGGGGRTVEACGPPAMLEAVREACSAAGVPALLAMESGMACGFGACFGCVVPTRSGYVRLCLDGPVLAGEDLDTALVAGAGH